MPNDPIAQYPLCEREKGNKVKRKCKLNSAIRKEVLLVTIRLECARVKRSGSHTHTHAVIEDG